MISWSRATLQADYHIDKRSAISSKKEDEGLTAHPNISRWHDENERREAFGDGELCI